MPRSIKSFQENRISPNGKNKKRIRNSTKQQKPNTLQAVWEHSNGEFKTAI